MSFCGRPIGSRIPMPPVKPPKQSRGTPKMSDRVRLTQRMSNKMLKLAQAMISEDQEGNQSREVNAITDDEVASILNDANELAECEQRNYLAHLWDGWKHADTKDDGNYASRVAKMSDTITQIQEENPNPATKEMCGRIASRLDRISARLQELQPMKAGQMVETYGSSSSPISEEVAVKPPKAPETAPVQPPAPEPQKDFDDEMLDFAAKDGRKYVLYKQEANGMWRIRACKDFGNVKRGDFGGLVQSEDNLSQYGECWIYDGAQVKGRKVFGTEKVVPEGGAE